MTLTPVRIRGKKRKPAPRNLSSIQPLLKHFHPSSLKSKPPKPKPTAVPVMPTLQSLPQELLEIIFLYSMNISLPRASPSLGRLLSSKSICMEYCMRSFFHTVDHKANIRHRRITSDPVGQSDLLSCRFFTWPFFYTYVEKAHDALIKQRGRAWAKTGVTVPDATYFDRLWPSRFTQITYLGFAEGFHIPEKLLHGPWSTPSDQDSDSEKAKLLYVLVSLNGEIDWSASLAGETAKDGMKDAIREGNEHAVAALAVLLGIAQEITTELLRYAVVDCGCNFDVIRHLLFNSQILYAETSRDILNFHDPALWQWADSQGGEFGKGVMLKSLLKRAETFSLQFYMDEETDWMSIVPFPYGGSKFDARTAFEPITRELLVKLYRNHGRRITGGARRRRVSADEGEE
ncbi:uncharacterized protein BDR25DRAFT_306359 [Lindgomyces ingoldianus]|uniref:Uncharacterized protein n=1 Tax=Lindgomyces ingoldianus TaxID=673940 RepID=A0ACB6QFN7_9PLEO|nr:uncharacterized protein BDR25DRAFT_306359 [Lindgomyces ingoldianus]KAF2465839.1 hypothetical protein BDR25DRAFT_306359 [Lindgomyces ingoldianus]